MPLFSFEGKAPQVHPDAWIAPTATLVGDVRVEAHASVWYGAVLRADFGPIVVREGANVQDGSVLHGGDDPVTEVGPGATIGHLCVVHGAVIGRDALVGNGAVVQDGARIGARSLVAAGVTRHYGPEEVAAFAWRIPFILSLFLVIPGILVRRKLKETPDFARTVRDKPARAPFVEVMT